MTRLYLDFETASRLSLGGAQGVGAHVYAEHPSTRVHCLCWAVDDGPVNLWRPGTDDDRGWERLVRDPAITKIADNCEFERALLRHKLNLDTPIAQWDDPAARTARIALPRKLEEAAAALKLPVQKDMEGHRVMLKLSKPRKPTKNNPDEWWTPENAPEDFAKLYAYCRDDVRAMRLQDNAVPPLSAFERRVWALTTEANERGIKVDTRALPVARAIADAVEKRLIAEFMEIVGVSPTSPTKAAEALGLPDFTEDTVRKTLAREDLDPKTRRALEVRQLQAYSSLKKLGAFVDRTSRDGRLRGSMIYSGAERTTRWSSGGVQIQNLPSVKTAPPPKDMDAAFAALMTGTLDLLHDDQLGALAGMLRGFLVGPFLVGDLAQVEARNTAWLAGQMDLVEEFALGKDPYKGMASVIYGVPFDKVVKMQREVGKRAILGCGYGMGPDKFQRSLDEQYGIKIDAALAERTVSAYRARYPKIPKLWQALGDGFVRAVRGKHAKIQAGPLEMGMTEIAGQPFAYIRLPSGRAIFYGWPVIAESKFGQAEVRYFGRDNYSPGKHWGHVSTWGGKITENVIQAVSRDLLADIMIRASDAGFPLAFTVHDELVVEGPPERLHEFEAIFKKKPEWARTLATGVEVYAAGRYRK